MRLTHEWKTQTGATAAVTCELVTSEIRHADGWNVKVDVCRIETTATVSGMGTIGHGITTLARAVTVGDAKVVAKCGRLAITADNMAVIDGLIADLKTQPIWLANEARLEKNRVGVAEYESDREVMRRTMGY